MDKPGVERFPDGRASIFFQGRHWRRIPTKGQSGTSSRWVGYTPTGTRRVAGKQCKLLERLYRNPTRTRPVRRFPRDLYTRGKSIRDLADIPRIREVSTEGISWLVDSLIAERAITLVTGSPGSYKTWLALFLAKAVSSGTEFLEHKAMRRKVLYLDRDNPVQVVKERCKLIGLQDGDHLKFWGGWLDDEPPLIGDERLCEIAKKHKPLLLFDSLVRFRGADENSATAMAAVMREFRRLANLGATIVILHHRTKKEESKYRGSSDILAAVDIAFAISKRKERPGLILESFKNRFKEESSIELLPQVAEGAITVLSDASVPEHRKIEKRLAQLITEHPRCTQQQLIEWSELPEHKVREILKAGVGRLWTVEHGDRKTLLYCPIGEK